MKTFGEILGGSLLAAIQGTTQKQLASLSLATSAYEKTYDIICVRHRDFVLPIGPVAVKAFRFGRDR
jgi:hypothetical protein